MERESGKLTIKDRNEYKIIIRNVKNICDKMTNMNESDRQIVLTEIKRLIAEVQ